ncbi:MAG: alpha/beta fold hydrolase [Rhizobiales bacterium]|nr:alpha/beta fold hydrolase [Hyphomicrobiales bacterium]
MKLVSIPANPVPEDVVTGMLKTPDGRALRFARFAPPRGRRGTVCLFQGRTEFIEKYYETVRDLRGRGFAVATLDWRGQGLSNRVLSDPRRGHVTNFAEFDIDLETFMREVVLPDCPPPLFALAHSMGGAILIRSAYQGHRWFDRVVLSAPMIALAGIRLVGPKKFGARLLRLVGLGASYIAGGDGTVEQSQPFLANPLTSDPVRYARNQAVIEAEPALGLGSPTVAWANAAFNAMDGFAEPGYSAQIRQPMLIIAAGADTIVSTPATEEFAIRLRAGSHLVLPGAKHEVLMERDRLRGQFWAAFDAFVPGTPMY